MDNLFVLLPVNFSTNGKADIILSSFTNYRAWKSMRIGDYYVYYPSDQKYVPPMTEYAPGQPGAAVDTK